MGFAPIFGRFCSIFLHLVQELTPNFGEFRNKFCNIFVTILPHLFCFGETSFCGGKKCRFSSFSGHRGGLFHCILGSPTRRAVEPKARLRGCMGESPCSGNCCFRFRNPEVLLQTKQPLCPTSPSSLRDATSPSRGGFGRPPRSWQTFYSSLRFSCTSNNRKLHIAEMRFGCCTNFLTCDHQSAN